MTYELALQLKNAGFPRSDEWVDAHGKMWYGFDDTLEPTLEELIEACGEMVLAVHKHGAIAARKFTDTQVQVGKTPKEAVAKLWLELNKY